MNPRVERLEEDLGEPVTPPREIDWEEVNRGVGRPLP